MIFSMFMNLYICIMCKLPHDIMLNESEYAAIRYGESCAFLKWLVDS